MGSSQCTGCDQEDDLAATPEVALGTQREENLNQQSLTQDREDDRAEDHHALKFHHLDQHQHLARLHLDQRKVKTMKLPPLTKIIDHIVTNNFVTSAPHVDSEDVPA